MAKRMATAPYSSNSCRFDELDTARAPEQTHTEPEDFDSGAGRRVLLPMVLLLVYQLRLAPVLVELNGHQQRPHHCVGQILVLPCLIRVVVRFTKPYIKVGEVEATRNCAGDLGYLADQNVPETWQPSHGVLDPPRIWAFCQLLNEFAQCSLSL
ncbi:hypothetical protein NUW58_g10467 [Xylaria curta]|uniref:Uncharacterized protein n=1 Tax=Xylaria curta TaxID=42375 RepID=A0ACC1MM87_9PEZI|nr:hypothetical protein NUW58_g10467 [Xylaria curta]